MKAEKKLQDLLEYCEQELWTINEVRSKTDDFEIKNYLDCKESVYRTIIGKINE